LPARLRKTRSLMKGFWKLAIRRTALDPIPSVLVIDACVLRAAVALR
jgi:multisubunit Na+/H+ antiporter MnhC subunit